MTANLQTVQMIQRLHSGSKCNITYVYDLPLNHNNGTCTKNNAERNQNVSKYTIEVIKFNIPYQSEKQNTHVNTTHKQTERQTCRVHTRYNVALRSP